MVTVQAQTTCQQLATTHAMTVGRLAMLNPSAGCGQLPHGTGSNIITASTVCVDQLKCPNGKVKRIQPGDTCAQLAIRGAGLDVFKAVNPGLECSDPLPEGWPACIPNRRVHDKDSLTMLLTAFATHIQDTQPQMWRMYTAYRVNNHTHKEEEALVDGVVRLAASATGKQLIMAAATADPAFAAFQVISLGYTVYTKFVVAAGYRSQRVQKQPLHLLASLHTHTHT